MIIEVLTFLTEHGDQTVRAVGLLKILSTFKFIMILEVMVSVLNVYTVYHVNFKIQILFYQRPCYE